MGFRVQRMKWITRAFVREHRDRIFLFGDNLAQRGFGGQASAMRGEPNVVGIPTKKLPSNIENAFFTDAEFDQNKSAIDHAFEFLAAISSTTDQVVVIPASGIGTGRAQLESRAPITFAYLQKRVKDLSK